MVASSGKTIPKLFLLFIIIGLLGFGLVDRVPWKGPDVYGVAAIKSCYESIQLSKFPCVIPNLTNGVFGDEGPLFSWVVSYSAYFYNSFISIYTGKEITIDFLDDFSRVFQIIFVILGLFFLWSGTKILALRRESRPVDPLGIGPNARKFSINIATCTILLTLSCLGLVMQWHEVGNTGLSFFFQSICFFALCETPEKPGKSAKLFAFGSLGLIMSSDFSIFISYWLTCIIICLTSYPWNLVKKKFIFISHLIFILFFFIFYLILFNENTHLIYSTWVENQLSSSKFQPWHLIKTWLWTWWPLWPIIMALFFKINTFEIWNSPNIKLPLILLILLTAFPLLGVIASNETKFIPIVPLAVLSTFGLLTLPRKVAKIIDWFALSIFSIIAIIIWSYWITLHTGIPNELYQDIIRAAPNTSGKFNYFEVIIGVFATISWLFLVIWRIKTRKPNLWRPLVLSAGGLALMWTLLMTLWGTPLNINRGFSNIPKNISYKIKLENEPLKTNCLLIHEDDLISRTIILAYTDLKISNNRNCAYFLERKNKKHLNKTTDLNINEWKIIWKGHRLSDPRGVETFTLFKKINHY